MPGIASSGNICVHDLTSAPTEELENTAAENHSLQASTASGDCAPVQLGVSRNDFCIAELVLLIMT